MANLNIGEKLHIVEKRMFADDVRRHFIGVVKGYDEKTIRMTGHVWIYHQTQARFARHPEKRERLIILGDRLIINIIPQQIELSELVYNTDNTKRMFLTDNKAFKLELSEFVSF